MSCALLLRYFLSTYILQLPCNSGLDLTAVENDGAVEETINSLINLARDSFEYVAVSITDILEKFAKVRLIIHLITITSELPLCKVGWQHPAHY